MFRLQCLQQLAITDHVCNENHVIDLDKAMVIIENQTNLAGT